MATLTEFVARTIACGIQQCAELGSPVEEIIVAGGGVKNPILMERIAALVAPIPVRRSDDLGVPSDAREAMAFAVLADMTLRGLAAWLPPSPEQLLPSCSESSRSLRHPGPWNRIEGWRAPARNCGATTDSIMSPIDLTVIAVYIAGCTLLGAWLGSRSQG